MADLTLTADQEAEAQRLAEIIAQKAKEEALRIARLLVSKADHELLGATEFEVRDRVHAIGVYALETALRERKKWGYQGSSTACPHCGDSARFVEYRPKGFVSLLGELRLSRGYYHCGHCGHGHFPWDATLRLSPQRLTPGAQEVVCLAGIQESFGKAAERTLWKLAGLRLSESTGERATEAAGTRLGERLQAGAVFGQRQAWDWNRDARGQSCAYVSLDATGILMQGPAAAKAEGHSRAEISARKAREWERTATLTFQKTPR
jgi:hypothetical protein